MPLALFELALILLPAQKQEMLLFFHEKKHQNNVLL